MIIIAIHTFMILLFNCNSKQNNPYKAKVLIDDTTLCLDSVLNFLYKFEGSYNRKSPSLNTKYLVLEGSFINKFIMNKYSNKYTFIKDSEICKSVSGLKDTVIPTFRIKYIEKKNDSIYFVIINRRCLWPIPKGFRTLEGISNTDTCNFSPLCGYTLGLSVTIENDKAIISKDVEFVID